MAGKDELLIAALDEVVSGSGGKITYDRLSSAQLETEIGINLPRSPNAIYRIWDTMDGVKTSHVGFTLLVDGQRRVATRASALASAMASSEGKLLSENPFLLVFDYVNPRILAISAARLFSNFLAESKKRALPTSASSSFALTPSFANGTISLYHVNTPPDVWTVAFGDPNSARLQLHKGLARVRTDTASLSNRDEVIEAIKTRLTGLAPEPIATDLLYDDVRPNLRTAIELNSLRRSRAPFREELNALGEASGVEVDEAQNQAVQEPFDPDEIEVQTRQITIDLLLSRLRHRAIDLDPEFQRRRGIWDDQRQSRLIESILLKIPLPTLYAAEDAEEGWAIVDGIQRMTAIARFASPNSINDKPLVLTGLEYLSNSFEGLTFEELDTRLKRRFLETELVLHVIRYGTPDAVKDNIFARINTGGIPLSRQELRHALIPGNSRKTLKAWAESEPFIKATSGSVSPDRMNDRELVLRFVAFKLNPPERYIARDFNRFLGDAMRQMNILAPYGLSRIESDLFRSLDLAHNIFGPHAFRKLYNVDATYKYPINKALFEVVSVVLSEVDDLVGSYLVRNRTAVVDGFAGLMNNGDFNDSISQGTGDIRKVRTRFGLFSDLIGGLL